jgi:hypothetical protein
MARLARLVIPGVPHRVTQRGNGRAPTFFGDDDYSLYRDLLARHRAAAGVEVWAWAPMPRDWRWSSVHAHLGATAGDGITTTAPVAERFPDLAERIAAGEDEAVSARLRRAEQIGRPHGDAAFIEALERRTGRTLAPARPGPKPKRAPAES